MPAGSHRYYEPDAADPRGNDYGSHGRRPPSGGYSRTTNRPTGSNSRPRIRSAKRPEPRNYPNTPPPSVQSDWDIDRPDSRSSAYGLAEFDPRGNDYGSHGRRIARDPLQGQELERRGRNAPRRYPRRIARGAAPTSVNIWTLRKATGVGLFLDTLFSPSPLGDGTVPGGLPAAPRLERDWKLSTPSEPGIVDYVEIPPTPDMPVYIDPGIAPLTPPQRVDIPVLPYPTSPDVPPELPPHFRPDTRVNPRVRPQPRSNKRPRVEGGKQTGRGNPSPFYETGTSIEFSPDGKIKVSPKTRPRVRAFRRRRETKYGVFYQVMLQAVNMTIGQLTEALDLVNAIAWNTYDANGELVMTSQWGRYDSFGAHALGIAQGIGQGVYTLDVKGFVADFVVMQAQDWAIGKASQKGQKNLMDAGWQRPVGWEAGIADNATPDHYI